MREHEIACFRQALPDAASPFRTINLPYDRLDASAFEDTDVFLVGGAGEFSVLDAHRFLHHFFEFLGEVCQRGQPMFASCFGFQALCVALGGEVIHDPGRAEVGTYELFLTDAGRGDPLFGRLPERFNAQLGHKDRATRLPESCINLAGSARSPYQALRISGQPIYATQFHPELTHRQNRERFEAYLEGYSGEQIGLDVSSVRESFRESKETSALLSEFINRFVCHKET